MYDRSRPIRIGVQSFVDWRCRQCIARRNQRAQRLLYYSRCKRGGTSVLMTSICLAAADYVASVTTGLRGHSVKLEADLESGARSLYPTGMSTHQNNVSVRAAVCFPRATGRLPPEHAAKAPKRDIVCRVGDFQLHRSDARRGRRDGRWRPIFGVGLRCTGGEVGEGKSEDSGGQNRPRWQPPGIRCQCDAQDNRQEVERKNT